MTQKRLRLLVALLLTLMLGSAIVQAQDSATIVLTGLISEMDDTTVTVNGLTVNITSIDATVSEQFVVGAEITIEGTLINGVLEAETVTILSIPEAETDDTENSGPNISIGGNVNATTVTVSGVITAMTDETITVNSLMINLAPLDSALVEQFAVGVEISMTGTAVGGVMIPDDIVIISSPANDDTEDSTAITITGVITAMDTESVTVNGLTVNITAIDTRVIDLFDIGVEIHISGVLVEGVLIADDIVVVSLPSNDDNDDQGDEDDDGDTQIDTDDLPVVIVLQGPVTAINNTLITVYDFDIQVSNDFVTTIEIGDVILVEGELVNQGDILIVIAVNITVVDVVVNDIDIIVVPGSGGGGGGDNDDDDDDDDD